MLPALCVVKNVPTHRNWEIISGQGTKKSQPSGAPCAINLLEIPIHSRSIRKAIENLCSPNTDAGYVKRDSILPVIYSSTRPTTPLRVPHASSVARSLHISDLSCHMRGGVRKIQFTRSRLESGCLNVSCVMLPISIRKIWTGTWSRRIVVHRTSCICAALVVHAPCWLYMRRVGSGAFVKHCLHLVLYVLFILCPLSCRLDRHLSRTVHACSHIFRHPVVPVTVITFHSFLCLL